MKIAQIAPLCEAVPPRMYGGTERIVAYLTDALVELGCDVTLFASAEANTRARLVPMRDQAIRLDSHPLKSDCAAHLTMLKRIQARAHEFDLLHFHVDPLHFPLFEEVAHRTLTTLHGRLDCKDYDGLYQVWTQYPLVSISQRQRAPIPQASWVATIPHGVPADAYPFVRHNAGDYLVFLGRISPEKRPDVAIRIASKAGMPLKIAAKVDAVDTDYFRESIQPLLTNPNIEFIGEVNEAQKGPFLGNALALLFPIDWPEPFGLVMIEAMACGTPVIAWNRGSVPEVIDDGVTGAIVESDEEALRAIEWARHADRARIRQVFERRFTSQIMARHYLDVYRHLLRSKRRETLPAATTSTSASNSDCLGAQVLGSAVLGGAALGAP